MSFRLVIYRKIIYMTNRLHLLLAHRIRPLCLASKPSVKPVGGPTPGSPFVSTFPDCSAGHENTCVDLDSFPAAYFCVRVVCAVTFEFAQCVCVGKCLLKVCGWKRTQGLPIQVHFNHFVPPFCCAFWSLLFADCPDPRRACRRLWQRFRGST